MRSYVDGENFLCLNFHGRCVCTFSFPQSATRFCAAHENRMQSIVRIAIESLPPIRSAMKRATKTETILFPSINYIHRVYGVCDISLVKHMLN